LDETSGLRRIEELPERKEGSEMRGARRKLGYELDYFKVVSFSIKFRNSLCQHELLLRI
jgi:hypothetical protein